MTSQAVAAVLLDSNEMLSRINMTTDQVSLTGWVLAGIGVVISTLAGIVAKFYQGQVKSHENEIKDHKEEQVYLRSQIDTLTKEAAECRVDRESLRVELAKLQVRVEYLEAHKTLK